jgi:leader peptidase (prepilin peptidase)/N-methyltransferase
VGPLTHAATIFLGVVVFLLGLGIGSFLNVCIYRMPRDESVVAPPSHCPACGTRLRPLDLIPLASYLLLGRRCRYCQARISPRYFLIELITGLTFLAFWLAYAPLLRGPADVATLAAYLGFASALIAIFVIDLEHLIIPDELVLAGVVLGVGRDAAGLILWNGILRPLPVPLPWGLWTLGGVGNGVPASLVGMAAGIAVFEAIGLFSRLVFRKEGMGGGDVKLAAAIGAVLGPGLALLTYALAIFAGAFIGGGLMLARVKSRGDYIPFGPFLAAAAMAAMLAPGPLLAGTLALYRAWRATWAEPGAPPSAAGGHLRLV